MKRKLLIWIFETFFKSSTTVEFKRLHGGAEVECQIRMFGWLVGRETVIKKQKPDKA